MKIAFHCTVQGVGRGILSYSLSLLRASVHHHNEKKILKCCDSRILCGRRRHPLLLFLSSSSSLLLKEGREHSRTHGGKNGGGGEECGTCSQQFNSLPTRFFYYGRIRSGTQRGMKTGGGFFTSSFILGQGVNGLMGGFHLNRIRQITKKSKYISG